MSRQQPTETTRPLFFSLSTVQYSIEPGATPRELIADAALLLGAGNAAMLDVMESLTEGQWAGLYVIQQAHALVKHAASLMARAGDGDAA